MSNQDLIDSLVKQNNELRAELEEANLLTDLVTERAEIGIAKLRQEIESMSFHTASYHSSLSMLSKVVDVMRVYADAEDWQVTDEGFVFNGGPGFAPYELAAACEEEIANTFPVLGSGGVVN